MLQLIFLAICVGAWLWFQNTPRPEPATPHGPAQTLSQLQSGNARFVRGHRTQTTDTTHDAALRRELREGVHPVAAVVCSEGTLAPDVVFDQKMGQLYVVRNPSGEVDDPTLTALAQAVTELHVRAVVVLSESSNAREQACELLRESGALRLAVEAGKVAVVAGVYDARSGFVRFEPVGEVMAHLNP